MKTIDAKLADGREYRSFDAASFERRATEDGEKIVEGYATTYNQPYELWRDTWGGETYIFREQVDPHAFDDTDM